MEYSSLFSHVLSLLYLGNNILATLETFFFFFGVLVKHLHVSEGNL